MCFIDQSECKGIIFFLNGKHFSIFFIVLCVIFIFSGMIDKFDGIVLRTLKYSDSLLIVDIYTRQRGRLSFLVPASRSKRGRVRSVLFQPLSMLSFTASYRQGKQLSRINDVQPYAMYSSIPYNVVKSSIAMFLAEVLTYSLREEEGNESLFVFLDRSFTLFDNLEKGYADFHIIFMSQLLRYLGIFPNINDFSVGDFFDLSQGCIVKEHPLHPAFLMPQDSVSFVEILRVGYESMHILSLNRELRGAYLATLIEYYRLHIPDFPKLKSFEVLKELFD